MRRSRPLSYWVTVARNGFLNDLNRIFDSRGMSQAKLAREMAVSEPYVSQMLNGEKRNLQIETMVKWARAVGAIVQIALVKEGEEVMRVVDYDTAAVIDGVREEQAPAVRSESASGSVRTEDWPQGVVPITRATSVGSRRMETYG